MGKKLKGVGHSLCGGRRSASFLGFHPVFLNITIDIPHRVVVHGNDSNLCTIFVDRKINFQAALSLRLKLPMTCVGFSQVFKITAPGIATASFSIRVANFISCKGLELKSGAG